MKKIPVSEPDITQDDVMSIADCAASGWVSGISPWVTKFEEAFAKAVGAKFGVAVNSGSTALFLAVAAKGNQYPAKYEVILPTFTMVACANAVIYAGMKPVFVDCLADTWCLDPEQVKRAVTPSTYAIMPVHIYGHPAEMNAINYIAKQNDIYVIEDCAEAHGATYHGKYVGNLTDVGIFSFYANKIITTGEGGILTTNASSFAERLQWLKAQAFGRQGKHFWHEDFGYGFRMSGLQAALGLSQVTRLEQYVEKRRLNKDIYTRELKKTGVQFPVELDGCRNVYWMYTVLLPEETNRDQVISLMAADGVETRPTFTPLHKQPIYIPLGYTDGQFPISEYVGRQGINLPSSSTLTEGNIVDVCNSLKKAMNQCS